VPEPFKNFIDARAIQELGASVSAAHPAFDLDAFVQQASDGLHALELKARVAHVSRALRDHLPDDWPHALDVLLRALPQPLPDTTDLKQGFGLWPVLHCVQVFGLQHPEQSLDALPAMTRRYTADFALRPYLTQHPELAWERVDSWVDDPDVHVRRLCSEGTRPRLPWGMRLRESVRDPSRGLAVLDRLVDDDEPYVRTSVGNHLNDVSKDHPERAVQVARTWLERPSPGRRWIVRRGLRTLVKKGDAAALELLGYGPPRGQLQDLHAHPEPARIGQHTQLAATLLPDVDQRWLIDWIIRAPRADGSLGHRVLKGKKLSVRAGQPTTLTQRLSLKPVTTRVTRPGRWEVAVQVNGQVLGEVGLEVVEG